jgi:hypothetical protein
MLLHNYIDTQGYTAELMKDNLSNISDSEIQSIKKRVEFYVNHFKISTKRLNSEAKEKQIEFLENLDYVLQSEINGRTLCSLCS